jgi:hypothetical protein
LFRKSPVPDRTSELLRHTAGPSEYVFMARSADWEQIRTATAAGLEPGEHVSAVFATLIPHQLSIGHVISAELVPLLWLMDHTLWHHRARTASRSVQVPLAPRMIIVVTDRNLMIWSARRSWQPGKLIGDLPRDRINQVTTTGTGTRTRLMTLHLSDGRSLTLQVSASIAADLARIISDDLPRPT